jgi:hypothetical protein
LWTNRAWYGSGLSLDEVEKDELGGRRRAEGRRSALGLVVLVDGHNGQDAAEESEEELEFAHVEGDKEVEGRKKGRRRRED